MALKGLNMAFSRAFTKSPISWLTGIFLLLSGLSANGQPIFPSYSNDLDPVLQWHNQQVFPGLQGHDSIVNNFRFNSPSLNEIFSVSYNQHGILDSITGFDDLKNNSLPFMLMGSVEHPKATELYYVRDPFYHPDTMYRFFFHYDTIGVLKRIEVRERASYLPNDFELVGDHRLKYTNTGQLSQVDYIHLNLATGLVSLHQREKYFRDSTGALLKTEVFENRDGQFQIIGRRTNTYGVTGSEPVLLNQRLERFTYFRDSTAIRDTLKIRFTIGHHPSGNISQIKEFKFNTSIKGYELRDITYYLQSRHYVGIPESKFQPAALYPNPAVDILRAEGLGKGTYTITNAVGAKMQEGRLSANGINVQKLPPGVYLLHWQSEEKTAYSRQKFVKR